MKIVQESGEIERNQLQSKLQNVKKLNQKQVFSFISNQHLSIIFLVTCGFFWVGGFVYVNEHKISPIEANYGRYYMQILLSFLVIIIKKEPFLLQNQKDLKILLIRSTISGVNGIMVVFFQLYVSLPIFYTLNGSIVIFVFLLNYFIYHIQITKNQIKAVIFSAIGIALTINGTYFYSIINPDYHFQSKFDYSSTNMVTSVLVCLAIIAWSAVWGYGIIITAKHHSSMHTFIFINSLVGLYMTSALEMMLSVDDGSKVISNLFIRKPDLFWNMLLYTAAPIAIANYFFNTGMFMIDNSGIGTLITQLNIVYGYFISVVRYDEEINIFSLLGSIILISSLYIVLVHK